MEASQISLLLRPPNDVLPSQNEPHSIVQRRSYLPPLLISSEPDAHLSLLQGNLDSKLKVTVK